jgi:hypothetical protein
MAPKPDQALEQAMLGTAPAVTPEPAPAPAAIDPAVIALAQMLLQGQRENTQALIDAQAASSAAAMRTAMRPENTDPPLMSAYNPRGDRDFPRPTLQCDFVMGTADMAPAQLEYEEIELLNQLTPGHYLITKSDNSQVTVSVVPTYDSASGTITKMTLVGPFGNKHRPEEKDNWPPLKVWLAEALGVPVPVRQETTPRRKTGRIDTPLLAAPRGANGIITGSLEANMDRLGSPSMRANVEAMLGRESDALAPSLA